MTDVVEVDAKVLRLGQQGAMSAWKSACGRAKVGIIDLEDLVAEAYAWIAANPKKIETWSDEGAHGVNKIRHACKQHCLKIVANERAERSKLQRGDSFYYATQLVKVLLPDIFNRENWTASSTDVSDGPKKPAAPSEGNNRLAMIIDVLAGFEALPDADQLVLREYYEDGGVDIDTLADAYEVSTRTIRRRHDRAVERLVERLGGENPWIG